MFPPSYVYDEFDGNERVFVVVDKNAEYKNGQMEMFKFLGRTLIYPKNAREKNIQGNIYIGFVIEKDGKLTNFKLKRGISNDCNEEAMRVIQLMSGDWEAGVFNGQKVRQAFTLPIKFKLE
jgi:periplasmic protein TonB